MSEKNGSKEKNKDKSSVIEKVKSPQNEAIQRLNNFRSQTFDSIPTDKQDDDKEVFDGIEIPDSKRSLTNKKSRLSRLYKK